MTRLVDLKEIQGHVVQSYGYGLPVARYYFLRVVWDDGKNPDEENLEDRLSTAKYLNVKNKKARQFLGSLYKEITVGDNSAWKDVPLPTGGSIHLPPGGATTNVAFTFAGLAALSVPHQTLLGFSEEFREGMRLRAHMLGDTGDSDPSRWDEVWRKDRVHIWVGVEAVQQADLDRRCDWLEGLVAASDGGIEIRDKQDAAALVIDGKVSPKEHFGYTDGISNPAYAGFGTYDQVVGRGKLADGKWTPLATGEILLGHKDEGGETPPAPLPHKFSANGTYMIYRKLHENTKSFRDYLKKRGAEYPGGETKLAAKFVGRWPNGAPLARFPDAEPDLSKYSQEELNDVLNNFKYFDDDELGKKCPLGAHTRRANPRDALGLGGKLANRRRLSRRGLPYGLYEPPGEESDDGEHGVAFMILNASIARQFEFVQQQWINYGNDFKLGNDKDVILGNNAGEGKAVVQGDAPYICPELPNFVECRGGDYFFVPSLSAIRMIANRAINPL